MNILITGATGLVGSELSFFFRKRGDCVFKLVRTGETSHDFYWQPDAGVIHLSDEIDIDIVIHLAGAGIADKRWSEARKREIVDSRVIPTKLLVEALSKRQQKPALLISASAIGFYGDTGQNTVDESSSPKPEFMSEICQQWEAASAPVKECGIRLVNIRTGIVLSVNKGALPKMLMPIKLGVGGKVGDGKQYMSWVSITELCRMIAFIIEHPTLTGPINLVSPTPVTNAEFTKALGKVVHRPTIFPLPAFVARMLFGEMADNLLLASNRVVPTKLTLAGFEFVDTSLVATIKTLIEEEK